MPLLVTRWRPLWAALATAIMLAAIAAGPPPAGAAQANPFSGCRSVTFTGGDFICHPWPRQTSTLRYR